MSILTALPGIRPTLRSFVMDEWPQGGAKMRGGRSVRWAQVSAPAGATMELAWENITYAQAQQIGVVWDTSYGTYGSLTLGASVIAGLDPALAALIEQPFPNALWRSQGPPVIESVKAGRCTVRLPLRTRYDLAPELAFPALVTGPTVSCALGTDPEP